MCQVLQFYRNNLEPFERHNYFILFADIDELQQAGSDVQNKNVSLSKLDFNGTKFSAYKLLQPVSELYSEKCTTTINDLTTFCDDFEALNIVELSTQFYRTKEMCYKLRVGSELLVFF